MSYDQARAFADRTWNTGLHCDADFVEFLNKLREQETWKNPMVNQQVEEWSLLAQVALEAWVQEQGIDVNWITVDNFIDKFSIIEIIWEDIKISFSIYWMQNVVKLLIPMERIWDWSLSVNEVKKDQDTPQILVGNLEWAFHNAGIHERVRVHLYKIIKKNNINYSYLLGKYCSYHDAKKII